MAGGMIAEGRGAVNWRRRGKALMMTHGWGDKDSGRRRALKVSGHGYILMFLAVVFSGAMSMFGGSVAILRRNDEQTERLKELMYVGVGLGALVALAAFVGICFTVVDMVRFNRM